MKTRFLAILTVHLAAITALQAQFAYVTDDGSIIIDAYAGSGGAVTIPATINGFPVTGIASAAFYDAFTVTSVSISSNVVSMGTDVFDGCTGLTNITVDPANPDFSSLGGVLFNKHQQSLIAYPLGLAGGYTMPNTVTNIAELAFAGAQGLTSVTISTNTLGISEEAFFEDGLTNVFVPASVLGIGGRAFMCLPLTNICVDASNTAFSSSAGVLFDKQRDRLIEYPPARPGAYVVSNSVTTITNYAFENAFGLSNLTLPAGLTSMGTLPFLDCTNLTGVTVAAGNTVYSSINGVLFNAAGTVLLEYPPGLAGTYTVPNGVTNIGSVGTGGAPAGDAFEDCPKLTGIALNNTVTTIEDYAFQSCLGLTSVTLPASVTNLGYDVFEGCIHLTNLSVALGNTVFTNESGVLFSFPPTNLIIYPGGRAGSYVVPNTVSSIAAYAFEDSINLTGVVIPDTVTSIGETAFYACTNLVSVDIPGSVAVMGNNPFEADYSLTSLTISNGVTSLPSSAFAGCLSLTTVTLPDSLTNIGIQAFYECPKLTTVFLGPNVTSIGEDAFDYCARLQGIYFAGNAPGNDTNGFSVFSGDTNGATAYYWPGTTGWESTFEGIPTAPWLPQLAEGGAHYGAQGNEFGFNINWAGNETLDVEACTNLAAPVWQSVGSAVLVNGAASFSDPQWSQYPTRSYRVSEP